MELSATYQKISELQERLDILSVHLELEEKQDRLEEVHRELENSEIWKIPDKAKSLSKEKVLLENVCNTFTHASSVLYDAKELLEMAEAETRKQQAFSLSLNVFSNNVRARSLYRKFGFDEEMIRCIKRF